MVVKLIKHDVSIHVLDLDTFSGVVHAEVCVRGKDHVGIYPTVLKLDNPDSLIDDITRATKDLLDQQGPFKVCGPHVIRIELDPVDSYHVGELPAENMDRLVRWLNRVWRDK